MASNTAKSEHRRARRHAQAGAKRKKKESRKSTPSYTELFANFGEPGQPVQASKA